MKITIWVEPDGATYIATPDTNIEAKQRIRLGHISQEKGIYAVAFQVPCLQGYNKGGFASRGEAISYEQDIINEHLTEYLHELF